jgi:hypothetical protein
MISSSLVPDGITLPVPLPSDRPAWWTTPPTPPVGPVVAVEVGELTDVMYFDLFREPQISQQSARSRRISSASATLKCSSSRTLV